LGATGFLVLGEMVVVGEWQYRRRYEHHQAPQKSAVLECV